MKISDVFEEPVIIDGGREIYFLKKSTYFDTLKLFDIKGEYFGLESMKEDIQISADRCLKYGLYLGFSREGFHIWFRNKFVKIDNKYFRIHVGFRTCKECGKRFLIGDATESTVLCDIGKTIEESRKLEKKIREKVWNRKDRVRCPYCGVELSSSFIWSSKEK